MKHTRKRTTRPNNCHLYARPYPNAADPQYIVDRFVDGALAVATAVGAVTAFLFLITM